MVKIELTLDEYAAKQLYHTIITGEYDACCKIGSDIIKKQIITQIDNFDGK